MTLSILVGRCVFSGSNAVIWSRLVYFTIWTYRTLQSAISAFLIEVSTVLQNSSHFIVLRTVASSLAIQNTSESLKGCTLGRWKFIRKVSFSNRSNGPIKKRIRLFKSVVSFEKLQIIFLIKFLHAMYSCYADTFSYVFQKQRKKSYDNWWCNKLRYVIP